jgi:hypothetical protein
MRHLTTLFCRMVQIRAPFLAIGGFVVSKRHRSPSPKLTAASADARLRRSSSKILLNPVSTPFDDTRNPHGKHRAQHAILQKNVVKNSGERVSSG